MSTDKWKFMNFIIGENLLESRRLSYVSCAFSLINKQAEKKKKTLLKTNIKTYP